jgi:hypothetical protein
MHGMLSAAVLVLAFAVVAVVAAYLAVKLRRAGPAVRVGPSHGRGARTTPDDGKQ